MTPEKTPQEFARELIVEMKNAFDKSKQTRFDNVTWPLARVAATVAAHKLRDSDPENDHYYSEVLIEITLHKTYG
jgi:hypothetical protein